MRAKLTVVPYPGQILTLGGNRWLTPTGEIIGEPFGVPCELQDNTRRYWEGRAAKAGYTEKWLIYLADTIFRRNSMTNYEDLVPEHWRQRLGWSGLSAEQRSAIGELGLHMYSLGSPTVSEIDEIKYDGRLVILEDGSRWEVDSIDVDDVDLWSAYGKVVVLDGVMYRLEDAEHADVTEEL